MLIGWFLHARFSSFVDVTMMSQKKNFGLKRNSLASDLGCGARKICKVTQARCDLRNYLDPNQGCERKKVVRWTSNAHTQKKTQLQQKREASPRKKRDADPHSMEKRWKQKWYWKVNNQIFLPILGLENKPFQRLHCTLTKWQRLTNFWQSLTSLEKLKYVATTLHKRSLTAENLNLTTAISMFCFNSVASGKSYEWLWAIQCHLRKPYMRWNELRKKWRWNLTRYSS